MRWSQLSELALVCGVPVGPPQDRLERVESMQWRQLLFALCFLHSTVQERRKFGPLGCVALGSRRRGWTLTRDYACFGSSADDVGWLLCCVRWCIPYEYNNGDLTACILFLEKHLYAGAISWPTFQ